MKNKNGIEISIMGIVIGIIVGFVECPEVGIAVGALFMIICVPMVWTNN